MMMNRLAALVEQGRRIPMSEADREEQRRTFAYGNTHIENEYITRQTVDAEAEALKRDQRD